MTPVDSLENGLAVLRAKQSLAYYGGIAMSPFLEGKTPRKTSCIRSNV